MAFAYSFIVLASIIRFVLDGAVRDASWACHLVLMTGSLALVTDNNLEATAHNEIGP